MRNLFLPILLFILCQSCETGYSKEDSIHPQNDKDISTKIDSTINYNPIDNRDSITKQLKVKIANNKPLIVHVFVPLCDNINQGIVPTSPKLGNGLDLRNNLYWGVRHGMKTIFKNNKNWKMLHAYNPENNNVLERVIYERNYGKTKVTLIMDAYRGDKMKETLEDYFNSLAENKMSTITIEGKNIPIYGNSDLLVFNGHNGLMDTEISYTVTKSNIRQKDAISISCSSKYYFDNHYKKMNAYPIVTTQNNLYPGGFILEGIIDKWATFAEDEMIRQEAGNSYHRVKKCGIKGARNLFYTGWEK